MTLMTIPLSPELEAKLRERAAALGKDAQSFVLQVVQEELDIQELSPQPGQKAKLSPEQRITELRAWAASHEPLAYEADDSRESIYEDLGVESSVRVEET